MHRLTIVNNGRGALRVHREGCADLTRSTHTSSGGTQWTIEVGSQREVIEDIYSDMIDEEPGSTWRDFSGDVTFLPCCPALPDEPTAPAPAVEPQYGRKAGSTSQIAHRAVVTADVARAACRPSVLLGPLMTRQYVTDSPYVGHCQACERKPATPAPAAPAPAAPAHQERNTDTVTRTHTHEPSYSDPITSGNGFESGTCSCGKTVSRPTLNGVARADNPNPFVADGEPYKIAAYMVPIAARYIRRGDKLGHETYGLREVVESPQYLPDGRLRFVYADDEMTEHLHEGEVLLFATPALPTDAQARWLRHVINGGGVDVSGAGSDVASFAPIEAAMRQGWTTIRRVDNEGRVGYSLTERGREAYAAVANRAPRAKVERVNAATLYRTNRPTSAEVLRLANRAGTLIGPEWVKIARVEPRADGSYLLRLPDGSEYTVAVHGRVTFEVKPAPDAPASRTAPTPPAAPARPVDAVPADAEPAYAAAVSASIGRAFTRHDERVAAGVQAEAERARAELLVANPGDVPTELPAAIASRPVAATSDVERSTGAVRAAAAIVNGLTDADLAAVLRMPPVESGPVHLVIVLPSMRRAVRVGPFGSPDAAREWWGVSWNRLAALPGATIVLVPASEQADAGRIVDVDQAEAEAHEIVTRSGESPSTSPGDAENARLDALSAAGDQAAEQLARETLAGMGYAPAPARPVFDLDGQTTGAAMFFGAAAVRAAAVSAAVSEGCPNPWHGTAPARASMVCPECPGEVAAATEAAAAAGFAVGDLVLVGSGANVCRIEGFITRGGVTPGPYAVLRDLVSPGSRVGAYLVDLRHAPASVAGLLDVAGELRTLAGLDSSTPLAQQVLRDKLLVLAARLDGAPLGVPAARTPEAVSGPQPAEPAAADGPGTDAEARLLVASYSRQSAAVFVDDADGRVLAADAGGTTIEADRVLRRHGYARPGQWRPTGPGSGVMTTRVTELPGGAALRAEVLDREAYTPLGPGRVELVDVDNDGKVIGYRVAIDEQRGRVQPLVADVVTLGHGLRRQVDEVRRLFRPGAVVRHRAPECADWRGVVVEATRGKRAGQHLMIEADQGGPLRGWARCEVRVEWSAGDAAGKLPRPDWYDAQALDLVTPPAE
ncbi:hypothetical protein [Micromonospora sp. NPDC049645]|uniref:hypothetical protein n=1 Tax=Micromonospora sp. NPDC049645 TaxID=3155508 RepID=UPI003438AB92